MKHWILTIIISLLTAAINRPIDVKADVVPEPTDWYPITVENRPFVRWWWLGSAVDPEGLTYNLEEFSKKGLGGVEITPIYGVKGNEENDIQFLSPEWMRILDYTISEGERLGLQVDMNNGTGWPFGGPDVGTKHAARKLVVEKWNVKPGEKFCGKILPSDPKQREVATLQSIMATNGGTRIDLTSKLKKDTTLSWKAPKGEGEWILYALFSGRTFQKVKRAAPGGEGFVLNHYDSVAVNSYLDRFDRAFSTTSTPFPDTFFNDSFEVYGSDWADNILEEFQKDHGYRLETYLPEFLDIDNHNDTRSRVVRDYRYTLANMLRKNFTDVWLARSHSNGTRVRNQSHGSPANIIDLYAAVDIPECESFGQTKFDIPGLDNDGPSRQSDADPAVLKFASSAAHLTGKTYTSAEALTWLTEHFRTSLCQTKPELDQMFVSGVNHVYFHGAPYSPKDVAFPGWMFYASINMSPTNSIWQDADSLFSYVSRVQSFLTAGVPDNDFLLYFPIDEIWQRQGGNPFLMFEIHKMDERMPDIKEAVNAIINLGYDLDYISDSLLNEITVRGNKLSAKGGAKYNGIIIPPVRYMQHSTLQRLLELAENGATVIFVGTLPSDVPGLSDLENRRNIFKSLVSALPPITNKSSVQNRGMGKIITAPDYNEALNVSGTTPEMSRTEHGLSMIRRCNEAGGFNYFMALLNNREINGFVKLATPAEAVEIFDPLTGKSGKAQICKSPDGETLVRLQLKPGQSLILKTFPFSINTEPWAYVESKGEAKIIDRGWKINFIKSDPPITGIFDTDSLFSWTKLLHSDATINFGTGKYSVEFYLEDVEMADDWCLDLGDVRDSADVKINGKPAGKVWSLPYTLSVGEFLQNGINSLEIEVTNIQANRIADYERRGVDWRIFKDANIASVTNAKEFNFGDWQVLPAGLNSKVCLIPLTLSK
ncbi:MAG: glycosyl hydrolase family 2 [Muribaculaceae bacterium]|nr:glycosyl hydrolase family 2 [Muribaculaceae bacterium]